MSRIIGVLFLVAAAFALVAALMRLDTITNVSRGVGMFLPALFLAIIGLYLLQRRRVQDQEKQPEEPHKPESSFPNLPIAQSAEQIAAKRTATPSPGPSNENITETRPVAPPTITVPASEPTPATMPAPAAPPITVAPSPWPTRIDFLLLVMVLVLAFFLGSFVATNSDLWLHLAIGRHISEGTMQFGVDPFSWASEAHGKDAAVYWVHHSWLYSWLLYQGYTTFGGVVLVVVKAILVTLTFAFLSQIGWAETRNRWFMILCLALAALAVSARLSLQPIVVSLLFLSITLFVLDRAGVFALNRTKANGDARWLWALPPLFALWANLDQWFILGPIVLALCWAATGLGRWFAETGHVPGKTLGIVFGVSLLACLVNPHHIHVFQLPPELGYLVLAITDRIGMPVPGGLADAGRTLKELGRAKMDSAWSMSTISTDYWTSTAFGLNVAAIALVPLMLMGLGGFTLMSLVKPQENSPSLQVPRFLLWLIFGIFALAMYRMIPFFVLIAAPLTAMTLGEFVDWQQVTAAITPERRDRGLRLARFLSIPFLLLILGMAWAGSLHAPAERHHPRRVAWGMHEDASLREAALELKALKDAGESRNVFNTGLDMGHYLAWFAPNVKHGFDTRLGLFARDANSYVRAREALERRDKDADWQKLFHERDIDQVTLTNFLRDPKVADAWWRDEEHWRERYGDGRTMVFSWARDGEWPAGTAIADLNRQAFGVVPEDRRPPAKGAEPPPDLTFWSQFVGSVGPRPIGVSEVSLHGVRFAIANQKYHQIPRFLPVQMGKDKRIVIDTRYLMSLAIGMPTSDGVGPHYVAAHVNSMRAGDFGPPAIPILMVRAARRAAAENPADYRSHLTVLQALETIDKQENHWIELFGPGRLRKKVRQVQFLTSLTQAVQARPEEWQMHEQLATLLIQEDMNDMALDHLSQASQLLEAMPMPDRVDPREFDAFKKEKRDKVKTVEQKIKERLAKWREMSEGKSPLVKAELALRGPYVELFGESRVATPLGLGKHALETLLTIKQESLKDEEQLAYLRLRCELLIRSGRADIVNNDLQREDVRKSVPSYVLLAGAAVGNYAAVDQSAAEIEKQLRAAIQETERLHGACIVIAPAFHSHLAFANTVVAPHLFWTINFNDQQNELCNLLTLRGICALEAGDTANARTQFQAAIDSIGDAHYFQDRAIARRYLDFLNEQKQKR